METYSSTEMHTFCWAYGRIYMIFLAFTYFYLYPCEVKYLQGIIGVFNG